MTLNRYLLCAAVSVAIHSVYVFADEPAISVAMHNQQQKTSLNIQLLAINKSAKKTVKAQQTPAEPVVAEPITTKSTVAELAVKPLAKEKVKPKQVEVQPPALPAKPRENMVKKAVTDHQKLVTTMKEPTINNDQDKEKLTKAQQPSNALPVQIQQPSFKTKPQPINYPRLAKRRNMQGEILVEIWLDEQGEQIEQRIISSSGYQLLDDAALASIKRWQFQGHSNGHQQIASRVQIPVTFTLD
ncbi:energy transducer TonB [Colwellia ponticola]|uniref:Energy transducer TonB n=1 Tax=Colwellia ponticola TaxID=2304625 RepID=A0A8H2JN87_9GAMM|nr:energy transducer TonB [Colwellia ponticola]TMM45242.1 energy transducer TonB [Colwellia ponticola]